VFIVSNTSGETVVLTQGSGGNVTIANNSKAVVYSDGGGVSAAVVDITPLTPTLAAIGALTPTDGNFIVGNGSTWVAESGNTVLQSIGVTATTAELNIMDGVTATTAELNYTDGVTSNIQTQINSKADNTNASIATTISLTGAASTWQFALSGNNLAIKYGATTLAVLDTSGNLTVKGDVTAFGSI